MGSSNNSRKRSIDRTPNLIIIITIMRMLNMRPMVIATKTMATRIMMERIIMVKDIVGILMRMILVSVFFFNFLRRLV